MVKIGNGAFGHMRVYVVAIFRVFDAKKEEAPR